MCVCVRLEERFSWNKKYNKHYSHISLIEKNLKKTTTNKQNKKIDIE